MTLKELKIGESAVIDTVGGTGELRQHFLDMGLIPGVEVTLVKLAPMGDPMELRIHGYELTLRLDDAAQIGITPTKDVLLTVGYNISGFRDRDFSAARSTDKGLFATLRMKVDADTFGFLGLGR